MSFLCVYAWILRFLDPHQRQLSYFPIPRMISVSAAPTTEAAETLQDYLMNAKSVEGAKKKWRADAWRSTLCSV